MGKFIDMTGQRIGRLTVLYRVDGVKNTTWHCRCDCGNEKDILGTSLRKKNPTQSCGCLTKEKASEIRGANLIGQTFGYLTVIKELPERDSYGRKIWQCKCKCGNITTAYTHSLKEGSKISCGCQLKSNGETIITKLLEQYKIPFISEYRFSDCKDILPLPFDFYINNKYLIEFDGEQHFKHRNGGWNTKEHFEQTKKHDMIKNQYCKANHIPLIRIPYTHLPNIKIEDLLLETTNWRVV